RSATFRVFRTFGPLESEGELGPLRAAVATVTPAEDASGAIRDLHNLILALGAMILIPYRGFPHRPPRPRLCLMALNILKAGTRAWPRECVATRKARRPLLPQLVSKLKKLCWPTRLMAVT